VGVEGRGAVRANDAEVLEAVVVTYPVDVVEDQRHMPAAPSLRLAAKLAFSLLDALVIQPIP
jgi:hypothetical protein